MYNCIIVYMNSYNNNSLHTFKILYNDILNSINNNENIIITKDKILDILFNIRPLKNYQWKSGNSCNYEIIMKDNYIACFENGIKHGLCVVYNSDMNICYGIYNKGILQTFVKYHNNINQILSYSKYKSNISYYKQFYKNGNTKINIITEFYKTEGNNLKCYSSLFNHIRHCDNNYDFIKKYHKNGNIKKQYTCSNNIRYGYYNSWNEMGETKKTLYYHNTNYYIIPDDLVVIVKLQSKIRLILKKIRLLRWFKTKNFNEWWWHPDNTGGRWVKNSLLKIVESK